MPDPRDPRTQDVKITCPKCAFEQSEAPECIQCGLIFDKWQKLTEKEKDREKAELPQVRAVIIFTPDFRIEGSVNISGSKGYRGRLSDYLNQKEFAFLAITGATLFSLDGNILLKNQDVILVNKDQISIVIPQ